MAVAAAVILEHLVLEQVHKAAETEELMVLVKLQQVLQTLAAVEAAVQALEMTLKEWVDKAAPVLLL